MWHFILLNRTLMYGELAFSCMLLYNSQLYFVVDFFLYYFPLFIDFFTAYFHFNLFIS